MTRGAGLAASLGARLSASWRVRGWCAGASGCRTSVEWRRWSVSIRQRLYPSPAQVAGLSMHCAHARFVWNLGLEQRQMWSPDHRGRRAAITSGSQMRELAQARAAFDWLRQGSSPVQQAALRDLDRAYRNWWANPGHFRSPTWRKAGVNESFYVRDLSVTQVTRAAGGRCSCRRSAWCGFA